MRFLCILLFLTPLIYADEKPPIWQFSGGFSGLYTFDNYMAVVNQADPLGNTERSTFFVNSAFIQGLYKERVSIWGQLGASKIGIDTRFQTLQVSGPFVNSLLSIHLDEGFFWSAGGELLSPPWQGFVLSGGALYFSSNHQVNNVTDGLNSLSYYFDARSARNSGVAANLTLQYALPLSDFWVATPMGGVLFSDSRLRFGKPQLNIDGARRIELFDMVSGRTFGYNLGMSLESEGVAFNIQGQFVVTRAVAFSALIKI